MLNAEDCDLEYLAPEILEYLNNPNESKQIQSESAHVWTLGMILVEIIIGIPISFKKRGKVITLQNAPKIRESFLFDEMGLMQNIIIK